jgi:hypothetical protein|tara:strand:- start:6319 stop:6543 length:225 start_codon:yes stop_codon:yes gene_type:complete
MMSCFSEDIHLMQKAAADLNSFYYVSVDSADADNVRVVVEFSGISDLDQAMWFGRYVSLLLQINDFDGYSELPN